MARAALVATAAVAAVALLAVVAAGADPHTPMWRNVTVVFERSALADVLSIPTPDAIDTSTALFCQMHLLDNDAFEGMVAAIEDITRESEPDGVRSVPANVSVNGTAYDVMPVLYVDEAGIVSPLGYNDSVRADEMALAWLESAGLTGNASSEATAPLLAVLTSAMADIWAAMGTIRARKERCKKYARAVWTVREDKEPLTALVCPHLPPEENARLILMLYHWANAPDYASAYATAVKHIAHATKMHYMRLKLRKLVRGPQGALPVRSTFASLHDSDRAHYVLVVPITLDFVVRPLLIYNESQAHIEEMVDLWMRDWWISLKPDADAWRADIVNHTRLQFDDWQQQQQQHVADEEDHESGGDGIGAGRGSGGGGEGLAGAGGSPAGGLTSPHQRSRWQGYRGGTAQQQQQSAAASSSLSSSVSAPHPMGAPIFDVEISFADTNTRIELVLREKHTILGAVEEFATRHDIHKRNIPKLVSGVEKLLSEYGHSLRLFSVPVKIDNRAMSVDFFDGEDVDDVVMDLLVAAGYANHEEFGDYFDNLRNVMYEYLIRTGKATREDQESGRHTGGGESAGADAGAVGDVIEPQDVVTSHLTIGNVDYEIEHHREAPHSKIAQDLCETEWTSGLKEALADEEPADMSADDCLLAVLRRIGAQWV